MLLSGCRTCLIVDERGDKTRKDVVYMHSEVFWLMGFKTIERDFESRGM